MTIAELETTPGPASPPDGTASLSDCSVVFADSREALLGAYRLGLRRDARVRTSSPAMLFSDAPNVESLTAGLDTTFRHALQHAFFPFSVQFHETLKQTEARQFALTLAREIVGAANVIVKAASLTPEDFERPRACLLADTGNAETDALLNPPWGQLLADNRAAVTIRVPVTIPRARSACDIGRLRLLRFLGPEHIGYRLSEAFWRRMPLRTGRGLALVLKENFLVRETAYHLALRGFAVRRLEMPALATPPPAPKLTELLSETAGPQIRAFLRDWLCAPAATACECLILRRCADAIGRQIASADAWPSVLDRHAVSDRCLILTNFPGGPEHLALAQICRERDIKLVAFQHGVAREISATHDIMCAALENTVADLFFTYNDQAAAISNENPFAHGPARAVGMPRAYFRGSRRSIQRRGRPVLFVSTKLYHGNVNFPAGASTDHQRAQFEARLVDDVLSRLPHRVLFKPYPDILRYADRDPVLDLVDKSANVECYGADLDLAYILPQARVLISSCATSTAGWCLMSGKPLVLIDDPGCSPFREDVRAALDDGVFLFDGADPSFAERLRSLLSEPIIEIERRWREKAGARARLIRNFFSIDGPGAGRRAAGFLTDLSRA